MWAAWRVPILLCFVRWSHIFIASVTLYFYLVLITVNREEVLKIFRVKRVEALL